MKRTILIALVYVFVNHIVIAQIKALVYTDFGHNQVSEGLYLKSALIGKYTFNKFDVEAGIQNVLPGNETRIISAWNFAGGKEFCINGFDVYAKVFFMHEPFSEYVSQSNWGVLGAKSFNRFDVKVGTNLRKYSSNGTEVIENANLMYEIRYFFKKTDCWKVGISLTNFDNFVIQQETNPMLNIVGSYDFNDKISLKSEFWYITAGAFNLHVNYFGAFLRTAVIWKI